ncbi:MAG: hypothetical protein VYB90_13825 [Actinomycetota bacterium]|nr:hypothetical protein [Actinomycetota bacterium]
MAVHTIEDPYAVAAALSAPEIQRAPYVSRHRQADAERIDGPHVHNSRFAAINIDGAPHKELHDLLVRSLESSYGPPCRYALAIARERLAETPRHAEFDIQRTVVVPAVANLIAHILIGAEDDTATLADLMAAVYFAGSTELDNAVEQVFDFLRRRLLTALPDTRRGCIGVLASSVSDVRFAYVSCAAFATAGFQNLAALTGSALVHCLSDCPDCRRSPAVDKLHVLRSISFQQECFAREASEDVKIGDSWIRTGDEVRLRLDAADRALEQIRHETPCPTDDWDSYTFKFGWGPHRCPAAKVNTDFMFALIKLVKQAHPSARLLSVRTDEDQIVRPVQLLLLSAPVEK